MLCEVARIEWYHRKWKDGNDRPFSSALSSCRDFPVITNAHVDMVAPFIRHQAEIKLLHILPMVEKQHSPRSEKLSRIIKKIQRYLDDPQLVYQHTQSKTAKGLYMEIAQKHRLVPKSLVKKNEGDDAEDVIFRAARGKVLIQVQDKRRYGTSAEFLGLADFAGEYVL
jgi:hypothetical protein